jgi:hypothetical protein
MYNQTGTLTKIASSAVTGTAGVALLPATNGNTLGMILAYGAITIGVVALVSHLAVRAARQRYQTRIK